jgi:L-cysteine S-thiosulfotransferase
MKKTHLMLTALGLVCALGSPLSVAGTPQEDQAVFQNYFKQRFPHVPIDDFKNGAYALDPVGRENWEAIEEFPPYEAAIDNGKTLWATPFANGKTYADCFPDGPGIAGKFPRWDKERGMVVTLPLLVNECRVANGEKPYGYFLGPLAEINAYMAFESRGQIINVEIPADDPRALAAYEKGKEFYFARRGQFNFSCAHCHLGNSGSTLRTEILSPALGHTTHFPVYRSKWGEIATLHRRYKGCNEQVRAKAFEGQSEEYRNLEYFMSYMDNGLELNGPGARK